MAREFLDGFEAGDLSLWDKVPEYCTVVDASTKGFQGGKCAYIRSGGITKSLMARDRYYVALKVHPDGNSGFALLRFMNQETELGSVRITGDYLTVHRGSDYSAGFLANGSRIFAHNAISLVEFYYLPRTDSTGRFVIKVNGVEDVNFTGQTANSLLQINGIRFGADNNSAIFIDDVVIDSANWIGNTRIEALLPVGPGNSAQFTPTAGVNYACVDDVPATDTDFVYTNAGGMIDTYSMGDTGANIGSIKAVQVLVRANYSGDAGVTSLKGVIRSGGANYDSASTAVLSTSMAGYSFVWETDPATSAAWTVPSVNAIEAGIKSV